MVRIPWRVLILRGNMRLVSERCWLWVMRVGMPRLAVDQSPLMLAVVRLTGRRVELLLVLHLLPLLRIRGSEVPRHWSPLPRDRRPQVVVLVMLVVLGLLLMLLPLLMVQMLLLQQVLLLK